MDFLLCDLTGGFSRARNLLEHCWFPWWCCMGYAGCSGLSIVSASNRVGHCGQILQDHEQVELASACLAEAD